MPHPTGRAAATTAAIERAALELVLEHGYAQVTVDMICEVAGISQRTFFNHFPTKDDALLGQEHPGIDERAARRFVISTGPILIDAIALISLPPSDAPNIEQRMKVIASSTTLLSRQIARITAMENELREIIELRLEHASPTAPAARRRDEAILITHLLSGVFRYIGTEMGAPGASFPEIAERTRDLLERVLAS
ncbi:TetR/AcrR family transcriptional regulator [Microbacterium phosphatis]|uniref:TetR/AcrR family transcriptional regulator n=1 Tax=Microbacterium phosphatis TaxID=3140248 RepID=UPI0031407BF8